MFLSLPLITPSNDTEVPTTPEVTHSDKSVVGLSASTNENEPGSESTVSATAKLLSGARDSAGSSSPLKTIAGGLLVILGNCEVQAYVFPHTELSIMLTGSAANKGK